MIKSSYSFMRTRTAGTHIQSHSHERYEFVYFFSGRGIMEYNDKSYEFSPKSYYLMEPGFAHSEIHINTGKSLVLWFNLSEGFTVKSVMQTDTDLNLGDLAEQIRQEMKQRLYRHDMVIDSIISTIVLYIARQQYAKYADSGHLLKNTIQYINEYYMTAIKISDLANECGYSVDHYRILFKKMTNQTPKNYILSKRIALAKKLLKETDASVTDICAQCGFEYYSHFMSFFKKKIGMTPGEYRDLVTNKNQNATQKGE